MLNREEGIQLVNLARESISSSFSGKELNVSDKVKKKFSGKQGCFVTLTIGGELRGCIGYSEPVYPLWEAIADAAKSAAFHDPRFPPLSNEEFKDVEIEVSVLTVPEEITSARKDAPKQIKIGRDGLIIESPEGVGLLLPQVFTEYKADAEQALEMTCQKAGLPPGAWKGPECHIYKFSAQIFH